MAYAITDSCVKDFLCADACSTDAIHPTQGEAGSDTEAQLYINPDDCIDCGSCIAACPNDAIFAIDDLPADKQEFAAKNAAYFQK